MKYIILFLISMPVFSQTVTDCTFLWDYEDQGFHDGFRFYDANDLSSFLGETIKDSRSVNCSELSLSNGETDVYVVAFNAAGESPPSNTVRTPFIVSSPPGVPMRFRLEGEITLTPVE